MSIDELNYFTKGKNIEKYYRYNIKRKLANSWYKYGWHIGINCNTTNMSRFTARFENQSNGLNCMQI